MLREGNGLKVYWSVFNPDVGPDLFLKIDNYNDNKLSQPQRIHILRKNHYSFNMFHKKEGKGEALDKREVEDLKM